MASITASQSTDRTYLSGFGNEHQTEALPGALPVGRRSPQRPAYGLYAEQLSGTAFTAPRASNRRTWFYRLRPSAARGGFEPVPGGRWLSGPLDTRAMPAQQLRWDPFEIGDSDCDFVDGVVTLAANGDHRLQVGVGIHIYMCTRPMTDRYFYDADGELLLVPQQGRLEILTECGPLEVAPGSIALIPRGLAFRIELPDGAARGYICENYGQPFGLPERGLVGSDGFANERDFEAPVAAFEDYDGKFELIVKFGGHLHKKTIDHSPLDAVAWWGNCCPYRYDLLRFATMGTISYDHPDPSIYTVLSSPSTTSGVANADFVIFPPRWQVADDTFRPPPYHRNVMSEFMGLIQGQYVAKPQGFLPGGASLHNCMLPHGPATEVHEAASNIALEPEFLADTLAFMFESRYVFQPTEWALESPQLQPGYSESWAGLKKRFNGKP
jgi:homogentisate 1,2-dioxygenase